MKDGNNCKKISCNRTRDKGFKLRQWVQTRYKQEIFYKVGEALEQVTQTWLMSPLQKHSRSGSEHHDLGEAVPAHCRGIRVDDL